MNLKLDLAQGILGLGPGTIFALLGIGLIVIYRGSGVLNFAHGAMAMVGALVYVDGRDRYHWGFVPSAMLAVGLVAAIGVVFHLSIMRKLRTASSTARTVATLGLLIVLLGGGLIRWGVQSYFGVVQSLPHQFRRLAVISGSTPAKKVVIGIGENFLWMIAIATVLTAALWALAKFSTFGMATTAAAENQLAAETLGWSSDLVAAVNWGLGAALAAIAGVLFAPVSGVGVNTTSLLVIPALAVGLIGSFRSFPLSLIAGLGLGFLTEVVRFETGRRGWASGIADSFPFLVIVVMLVVRGKSLPVRDHVFDRPPELGLGRVHPLAVGVLAAVTGVLVSAVFGINWVLATSVSFSVAIVLLSIVVVTGYTGQVSLAQFAFAGFGALTTGHLINGPKWPFPLAILVGMLVCVPIGALFGLPALRTRGVNLAVVTLGLGTAAYNIVFTSRWAGAGKDTLDLPPQHFLGLNVDPLNHPKNYTVLTLACFTVCALVVASLRRSRVGRRLIAVRGNERAAAALGVNVVATKLYAFALSAAIAGLGGILLAFRSTLINFANFDPFTSVTLVANSVIGGIGFVIGPLFGQMFAPGSIGTQIGKVFEHHSWIPILLFGLGFSVGIRKAILAGLHDHSLSALRRLWRVGCGVLGRIAAFVLILWIFADTAHRLILAGGLVTLRILTTDPHGIAFGNVHMFQQLRAWAVGRRAAGPTEALQAPAAANNAVAAGAGHERVAPATLEVRGVTVKFGGVTALDDVSLEVRPGQIVGLIGPNGAGKTTLIDAVTGFNSPSGGDILLNGRSLRTVPAFRRTRAGLSRSFQALELFEELSVADNLRTACDKRDTAAYLTALVHAGKEPLTSTALAAVDKFRLGDHLATRVDALSYGLRRLTGIARAVAGAPSVLLLDEPAAGLGDTESGELAALVRELADEWGIAVLVVEHDMNFVMNVCDHVVVLDFGCKIGEGTPAEIQSDPRVIAAYLGEPDSHFQPTEPVAMGSA